MNDLLLYVLCVEKDAGSSNRILSMLFTGNDKYSLTVVNDRRSAFLALRNNYYRFYLIDYRLAEANWSFLKRSIDSTGRETPFIFFNTEAGESAHFQAVQLAATFCRPLSAESINSLEDIFGLLQKFQREFNDIKNETAAGNRMASFFFTFI